MIPFQGLHVFLPLSGDVYLRTNKDGSTEHARIHLTAHSNRIACRSVVVVFCTFFLFCITLLVVCLHLCRVRDTLAAPPEAFSRRRKAYATTSVSFQSNLRSAQKKSSTMAITFSCAHAHVVKKMADVVTLQRERESRLCLGPCRLRWTLVSSSV